MNREEIYIAVAYWLYGVVISNDASMPVFKSHMYGTLKWIWTNQIKPDFGRIKTGRNTHAKSPYSILRGYAVPTPHNV